MVQAKAQIKPHLIRPAGPDLQRQKAQKRERRQQKIFSGKIGAGRLACCVPDGDVFRRGCGRNSRKTYAFGGLHWLDLTSDIKHRHAAPGQRKYRMNEAIWA